ncbi:MAG TPA: hypothetical protein VFE16_05440 [Candidatus Cybelea sp.]|jgi:hypothetical protein|nr:hypothetical protein [Candidatus Cybelea sp.]
MASSPGARKRAFDNALSLVDAERDFPQNVFRRPEQYRFLFFETEYIFVKAFVGIARAFLEVDHGEVVCLLNLWRLERNYERTAIYIDRDMDDSTYWAALWEGTIEEQWISSFGERFVCCSDSGTWAMYCERSEDFSAIAIRSDDVPAFQEPLKLMRARPCKEAFDGYYSKIPTNEELTRFRLEIAKHYPGPA